MTAMPVRRFCAFILLSVADLVLTHTLIQTGDGSVVEGNPIADAWLTSFGWWGMAFCKLGTVLVVTGACVTISRYRPRLAGGILTFGCAALTLVVLYSYCLVHVVAAG